MNNSMNFERSSDHADFTSNDTGSGAQSVVREMVDDYRNNSRGAEGRRNNDKTGLNALTFDNIFSAIDRDHDQQVSRNEFFNFLQSLAGQFPKQPITEVPPGKNPPDCGLPARPVPPPDAHIPPGERPPIGVPPVEHHPGCPGGRPPYGPPDAHIPPGERPPVSHPPDAHIPPGERPPVSHPPDAHIPPGERPPVPAPGDNHPPTGNTNGNFSTRDGKIYDPKGREFQPRGIDVDNMSYALQDIDKITKDWSANIIRINPKSQWDGPITYDKELLKKVVDEYTKRGVVVEITDGLANHWGDLMNDKQIADHANYYKELAEQFKGNPYVWFASPNEAGAVVRPNSEQDRQWLKEQLAMGNAIRSTGNNNMIVQGDSYWGQGATNGGDSALLRHADEFKKFGNVIAGQHVYNDRPDAAQRFNNAVDALHDEGFAVVVDEVSNWGQAAGEPTDEISNGTAAVIEAVDNNEVGMLAFRWFEHNPNHVFNLTDGGRGQGAFTRWGREVWRLNHAD